MSDEELTSDEEEQLQELLTQGGGDGGYPKAASKESQFRFFREILDKKDSSKVANYTTQEIGIPRLPVRAYLDIAAYAESEKLDEVAAYLRKKSEIISSTSMGRKGFLSQLFVTQIKKEQKVRTGEDIKKKGWFANKSEPRTEG